MYLDKKLGASGGKNHGGEKENTVHSRNYGRRCFYLYKAVHFNL